MSNKKNHGWLFSWPGIITMVLTSLALIALMFFLFPFLITQRQGAWSYTQNTGYIGDSIGGIVGPMVGFIGVVLTFLAFYLQFRANQIQLNLINEQKLKDEKNERQIKVQQIENRFFELLKLHRENVKEIRFRGEEGRNFFVTLTNEFRDVLEVVEKSKVVENYGLSLQDKVNITYLLLFFGVSDDVLKTLENRFNNRYHTMVWFHINAEIIAELKRLPSQWAVRFNGHQGRLGHYYRHLFRAVNFIHNHDVLTQEEKDSYISLLRTQLSTHEQIIFFFNSLSDLGLIWEMDESLNPNEKLISKYNLIRNIPMGGTYEINPRQFYPNVDYDHPFEITFV